MTFLLILTTLVLLVVISLTVFGGGQIFIPIFKWFWNFLNSVFHTNIDPEEMSNLFTISNSTPGIFSTKLAFVSGFLIIKDQWWGFAFCFLTYLIFIIVPILITYGSLKLIFKNQTSNYFNGLMNVMNPVISGIMFALVIQLLIGIMFPHWVFNDSIKQYAEINNNLPKAQFFTNNRRIALFIYIPVTISYSAILYKNKFPMALLILMNVLAGLLIFQPWS